MKNASLFCLPTAQAKEETGPSIPSSGVNYEYAGTASFSSATDEGAAYWSFEVWKVDERQSTESFVWQLAEPPSDEERHTLAQMPDMVIITEPDDFPSLEAYLKALGVEITDTVRGFRYFAKAAS